MLKTKSVHSPIAASDGLRILATSLDRAIALNARRANRAACLVRKSSYRWPAMKVSKRGEYALRALIDFGIAHELGRPLLKIGELVEKERLPVKFLEQILTQLKGGGYIETKRGKAGGYFLAKHPRDISLGRVIRLIDGPLAPIACVSQMAYSRCTCPDEDHCGLRMLMLDVRNAIARILDRYVLADIVEITLRKMRRDKVPIPFMVEQLLSSPSTNAPRTATHGHPAGSFLDELGRRPLARLEAGASRKRIPRTK